MLQALQGMFRLATITLLVLLSTAATATDTPPPSKRGGKIVRADKAAASQARRKSELSRLLAGLKRRHYDSAIDRRYQARLISQLNLILRGENINVTYAETQGCTALHYACSLSDLQLVRWLVDNGADLEAKSNRGATVDDCVTGSSAKAIRSVLRRARKDIAAISTDKLSPPISDRQAAEAAAKLQEALAGKDVTHIGYEIPRHDAALNVHTWRIYNYMRQNRTLPPGVERTSLCGEILHSLLGGNMRAERFQQQIHREVYTRRLAALSALLDKEAHFAEYLDELHLLGNESDITITFDKKGIKPPRVEIQRTGPALHPAHKVLLHFVGYVAAPGKGDTRATIHREPQYKWISISNDSIEEAAAHYAGHCAHVRYDVNRQHITYHPSGTLGTTSAPQPGTASFLIHFTVGDL